ncbi:putative bifunctional diguanylate cyclase/phosphodiesterase [Roseobacteraceae bacterium S113]
MGCAYFAIANYKISSSEAVQRQQLIDMTNAFTTAFSAHRDEDNLVPATFRRIGIEEFTEGVKNGEELRQTASTMRMPGTPGLELETVEDDPHIRAIISQMAGSRSPEAVNEQLWRDGTYIGRTIIPSIASNENCVVCHNTALGRTVYQTGDVMGAFVVETDLTPAITESAIYSVASIPVVAFLIYFITTQQAARAASTVKALKRQVSAEQSQRQAEKKAAYLASYDALTNAANRKLFQDRVESNIKSYEADGARDVILGLIDLDDFKLINDTMGHDAGDAVLVTVAQRLRDMTDPLGGMVARFGGDEFAIVLMPQDDAFDISAFGDQLVETIQQEFEFGQIKLRPRCSIGIAYLSDSQPCDLAGMMKCADVALYSAKEAGKSCCVRFDQALKDKMGRRLEIITALPHALSQGDVRAVLQPKVDLRDGSLVAFEALARWNFRGIELSPAEFIPLAEESRMIEQVDFHVLRHAGFFVAQASAEFGTAFGLSVNVSTIDLRSSEFVEKILDVLFETRLEAEQLTLEITESVFMQNWDKARETLGMLQSKGVRLALDDFGTGYSSLSYVLQFPFDEIKIDRSLARDVTRWEQNRHMLEHLTRMFHDLGKIVTIEGVETWDQTQACMDIGMQMAQGFYFAPPLEMDEARDLIRQTLDADGTEARVTSQMSKVAKTGA